MIQLKNKIQKNERNHENHVPNSKKFSNTAIMLGFMFSVGYLTNSVKTNSGETVNAMLGNLGKINMPKL